MTRPPVPPEPPFRNSLASSGVGWRSEEDYLLARLAMGLGMLDAQAVQAALRSQGQAIGQGQSLSLSQVLVREGKLSPQGLLQLKGELARSLRTCPSCGQARYLAAGQQARVEPCPRCGAGIPVPPASQSLSASAVAQREAAMRASGTARWRAGDHLAAPEGGPRLFGEFVLEQELARGGMGAVYRARHEASGQVYALKVLLAGERATEAQVHRFKRELKAQTELDHPHVVKVHHAGEWEGVLYCAMDLVEGEDLAKAMPRLGVRERVELLAKVSRAIHHAHEHGYVHRDLKPGNVLVDQDGEPKVTDFGLAKQLGGETRLTREGSVLGTPYYMAPEQASGNVDQMGPRTDVWALGVLLYEALTDQLPFSANTAIELYRKICEERPQPLADFGQTAPELQTIVARAMEKRPDDRYPSALLLAEDMERWLRGEAPQMSQISSAVRLVRKMGQHRRSLGFVAGVVGAGVLLLGGLVGVSAWILGNQRREQARLERRDALVASAGQLERLALPPPPGSDRAARAAELDAALTEAARLLAGDEVDPALRAALDGEESQLARRQVEALLARAELGLLRRDRTGARRALECARQAGGERAGPLEVRALRRLGQQAELDARLEALRKEGGAAVTLLEAELHLPDDPQEALRRLGPEGTDPSPEALLVRGRALLAGGKEQEAREEFARARKQGGRRALLAEAEAWREAGLPGPQAAALEQVLAEDADPEVARALLQARRSQGRPDLAARALEGAAGAGPEQRALSLRARELCGDLEALDALAALAPTSAEARLRLAERADVGPVTTAWDAAVAARGADPRPLAGRARARARRGDREGARADLELLAPALEEAPADVPPRPDLARALRDAGWARWHLQDARGAAGLAALAARGLPEDLDAALLLAKAAPGHKHPAGGAEALLRRELSSLEGPLGRGLFLARLARWRRSQPLAELARPLLLTRLAGDPGLEEVQAELLRLDAPVGAATGAPAPPFDALLPALTPPTPLPKAQREELIAEAGRLMGYGRTRDQEAIEGLAQVVAKDPTLKAAQWELGARRERNVIGGYRVWSEYFPFLGLSPTHAFRVVFNMRHTVRKHAPILTASPAEDVATAEREAPDSLEAEGLWVMERYFGLVAEPNEEIAWSKVEPEVLLARVDLLLARRPQAAWLLWVRAHVAELAGPRGRADRDLAVLEELARVDTEYDGRPVTHDAHLYAIWILAPSRPEKALQHLHQLPPVLSGYDDGDLIRLKEWFKHDPRLKSVYAAKECRELLERIKGG